jgi:hypothetical protein
MIGVNILSIFSYNFNRSIIRFMWSTIDLYRAHMDNGFSLHAINLKVILLLKAFNRINNNMYVVIKTTVEIKF